MTDKKQQEGWLEKLQGNSWQVELLISGGIVYTLYQLPSFFERRFIFTYETTIFNDTILLSLISLYLMTRILLIGFSVNLVLRAIWVAYIGIHATFPKGINRYDSKRGDWINERYPDKQDSKTRLEQFESACNLSYSAAILLCLMSISIIILMFIFFEALRRLPYNPVLDSVAFKYITAAFCVLLVIGGLDSLFYRLAGNRPRLQKWGQRIFKFWDGLTFAFLYKKEWLILITNIKAWKVRSFLAIYFALGLFVSINQIGDYLNLDGLFHIDPLEQRDYLKTPLLYKANFNNYYNKLPDKKNFTLAGCISEDIVQGRYMWVFVSYWKNMDDAMKYFFDKNGAVTDWSDIETFEDRVLSDSLQRKALREMILLEIDDQRIEGLEWYHHQLFKTAERGFITYIDTDALGIGPHHIQIQIQDVNWKNKLFVRTLFRVPFWKE